MSAADQIITLILTIIAFVMSAIGLVDGALSHAMTSAGIPHDRQFVILVVFTLLLAVAAVRLLGGLLGWLCIILLVLMLLHHAVPVLQSPGTAVPSQLLHAL